METSLSTLIDSASSILILLPTQPNFDQVAAGISLYLSIRDKKPTTISCSTAMTVDFSRLVGVNKITQEIGNKNLTIAFPNYQAENIEKVSYDIENGQFKLTVIPKAGFTAPQEGQVEISYSGISADLVILLGGVSEGHFPQLASQDLAGAKLAHIGTRVLAAESDKGVMSFARPASSLSELVATVIKENDLPLDQDIASNLLMGVEQGSNHFESLEVTPETFEIFAYLLRNGGQRQPRVKLSPASFPAGSIPTQPYTQAKPAQPEPILEQAKEEPVPAGAGEETPPSDWLQPKIYKGTSIS